MYHIVLFVMELYFPGFLKQEIECLISQDYLMSKDVTSAV